MIKHLGKISQNISTQASKINKHLIDESSAQVNENIAQKLQYYKNPPISKSVLVFSGFLILLFMFITFVSLVLAILVYRQKQSLESRLIKVTSEYNNLNANINQKSIEQVKVKLDGKTFSLLADQQFSSMEELVDDYVYITPDVTVDEYIINLATSLGYKIRPLSTTLMYVEEQQLNPSAANAWLDMKNSAALSGISMNLVSGFRTYAEQRSIFLQKSGIENFSYEDILSGYADDEILEVLNESSIPGFSKHHTGFAIDIEDATLPGLENFGRTNAYQWLSENNFENALKFGFVPSYPQDLSNQGPQPEPWEFVYVGVERIKSLDL